MGDTDRPQPKSDPRVQVEDTFEAGIVLSRHRDQEHPRRTR